MDTQYKSQDFLFKSLGLVARTATDRLAPGQYINLLGAFEREEAAFSSRLGSRIINRDPNPTGDGTNYLLPEPIQTLTRLKYNAATFRYAGSGEGLYRRTGDTQGQYANIFTGLSGEPFGSAIINCFASSQPYLFIGDQDVMLKDSGTGLPTQWGITPPNQPANATEYAPQILMIDNFLNPSGDYATSNTNGWSPITIGTVTASASTAINDFFLFDGTVTGFNDAFNGSLAIANTGPLVNLFNLYGAPNPEQFSASAVSGTLSGATTGFTLGGFITGTIAASTTATVGATIDLDLSQNNQVTLQSIISFAMQLSDPAGISQVNIMFDINNSGYTSSYYQAAVSPAYYQSGIDNSTDAYTTTSSEILALSLGLVTGDNSATTQQETQAIVNQLQPTQANTGQGAWSTVTIPIGNFLAVGNAGNPGFGWANVTGWQIQVITTTSSSVTLACNGLYLIWNAGPSSFGGTGYDYRFTYFNANTQTESNGSSEQYFSQQFGYPASYVAPIVLCQNFNVTGLYSSDPQVTHIRLYRRGGYMNANWYYLDQIPNVTAGGTFSYKDIISDMYLLQSNILNLANDAPITSSLQNPIVTTLTAPTTGPGESPYSLFAPQTVTTAQAATFLPNQLVVVGTPQNLEQVAVVTGGVGTFTAVFRLTHAAGEQVQVFSIPQQPCDLVTAAYGQLWVAGDPNNPHYLYYSNPGYPESFSPANYIPCGTPASPIMAVINFRGTLVVATLTTWYTISPGNPPYAQPTGSIHGLVSKTGWTQTESAIWYSAIDGLREFRGSDGLYKSLNIEWIFQDVAQTPVPLLDISAIGDTTMAFRNNNIFTAYKNTSGGYSRINFNTDYQRFRNDDVPAIAMYFEQDTNVLLYAKFLTAGSQSGYAICQDQIGDYDDGGWVNGLLTKTPINFDLKAPYEDLGAPHYPKNWNTVEVDANTNGEDMEVILNFDDGIAPLNLGTINTTQRQKIQLEVNAGDGQESYKCSPEITASLIAAPILYQMNIYAAVLAADRTSLDTYWIKFNTDTEKVCKQVYLDYTSPVPVTISIYADGSSTPYYTVTLPQRPDRAVIRERFPALKFRTFRMIVTSAEPMQIWSAPRLEWKPIQMSGSGWQPLEIQV
jgi:hypothetical protein